MTAPTLDDMEETYQDALRRVRARMGALDATLAGDVEAALRAYADRLEREVGALPDNAHLAQVRSVGLIRALSDQLRDEVTQAVDRDRGLAFEDVKRIWDGAMSEIASAGDVPDRLLGGLHIPSIQMLGQYGELQAAGTWKTLVAGYTETAAAEADQIVFQAIANGVGPVELAARLRRYVEGSLTFSGLFRAVETPSGTFEKIDLRAIPGPLRGAARRLDYNARRIAFTELHNARAEAEVQMFAADPFVEAVKWTLSPDRGTQVLPDECDILARGDFYGLGPGVYPVEAVPAPPHPFDRCERLPVPRPWARRSDPKPSPEFQPDELRDVTVPGRGKMSGSAWTSALQAAFNALTFGAGAGA